MESVWGIQRLVRRNEVATRDECGRGHTTSGHKSDIDVGSNCEQPPTYVW